MAARADETVSDAYARLARGCKPRGCRAPARRVHGRRVRYVIGSEPGQVNGMRWRGSRARLMGALPPDPRASVAGGADKVSPSGD
ncbi:tryptophan biosynthesis modulator TrpM [Streptomyces lunaelactis]|uniref:tryptophan biosynthesis modulator TrpM n=1 Tax=Streptomyces lunaelactis TaxID=1535768 RepID=UPI0032B2CD4B